MMYDPAMWNILATGAIPTGFMLLLAWSLFWKGLGLWHSARRSEPWWFVALLLINTAGILEIVYLFFVAKRSIRTLFIKD